MRRLGLWVVVAIAIGVMGCGGGSSSSTPTTTTTVTISPTATQLVPPGGTVAFTAVVNSTDTTTGVVTNITSTGVTWEVNGTVGGAAATGTISTTGLFTAPATVNVSIGVTVSAVSVADTSASAVTPVTLIIQPKISIAPTSATVAAGQTQTFTATVTESNQTVNWSVNNVAGGNSTFGFISPAGVYTPPQVPPPGGQVNITAVLNPDTSQNAAAVVTDTYSPASLVNSYAFLIRGETTRGRFLRAGTFTADGQGNITGGIEDINGTALPSPAPGGTPFTGTYSVGADGRGTLIFNDNFGSNFGATSPGSKFSVVVVSAQQVQVAEADVFASGGGEADFQSSSPPSATAFSGAYVFDFSGTGASAEPLSIIGEFNSALTGVATSGGVDDINDNGSLMPNSPVTFSYVLGAVGGRSTATLVDGGGTKNFSFYMLPAGRLRFIETDSGPVVGGDAVAQQTGLSFDLSDLGGSLLVHTVGLSSSGTIATVVSFGANGTASSTSPVSVVQNNAGTVTNVQSPVTLPGQIPATTATYTVLPNGRGTITLVAGQSYVFYLIAPDQGVVQETDNSSIVSDGLLVSSSNSPLLLTTLSANVAMQWSGAGTSLGEQDTTGQFVAASGNFKAGTLDSNTANGINVSSGFAPIPNVALTPATPYLLSTATGTINVTVGSTNLQFAVFFTSQTSAVILRVDTSDKRALSGIIAKQF